MTDRPTTAAPPHVRTPSITSANNSATNTDGGCDDDAASTVQRLGVDMVDTEPRA